MFLFSGDLVLSDFDLSNLEKKLQWQVQLILPLMCSFNFQIGCQDRLRVNSDADEALAELDTRSDCIFIGNLLLNREAISFYSAPPYSVLICL